MAATEGDLHLSTAASWRTPLVIIVCGCVIGLPGFGPLFEKFGSYTAIWWLSVLFGVLSALINLPIVEAPVARPVAQPA